MSQQNTEKANTRVLKKSLLVVAGMFAFGYALVPFYNLVCQALGVNGQTEQVTEQTLSKTEIDKSRLVTVELNTIVNSRLPWAFKPEIDKVKVHPGELKRIKYVTVNQSGKKIVGQAIHSVMPPEAAMHFKKTECFCYTQQSLNPGETREMTVLFMVDPRLPKEISTVTLSYNFLRADKFATQDKKADKKVGVGG